MEHKLSTQYIWLGTLLTSLIMLVLNILSYGAYGVGLGRIVLITVTNITLMVSILMTLYKPVITMLLVTLSQITAIADEMLQGNTFKVAVENVGYTFLIGIVVTLGFIIYIAKKNCNKKDKLVDNIKKIILHENKPLKLPIWSVFIIWCMFLTVLFSTANSDLLVGYEDKEFQIFAAAVLISPTFLYLSVYTVSNMTYHFYGLYSIIKLYTLYKLYIIHSLDWITAVATIIELLISILIITLYIKQRKVEKLWKKREIQKENLQRNKSKKGKRK